MYTASSLTGDKMNCHPLAGPDDGHLPKVPISSVRRMTLSLISMAINLYTRSGLSTKRVPQIWTLSEFHSLYLEVPSIRGPYVRRDCKTG